jgi:hypothetical protein
LLWSEGRAWDGQEHSLEAKLALATRLETTLPEVSRWVIAEAMNFCCEVILRDEDGDRRDRREVDLIGLQSALATQAAAERHSLPRWLNVGTSAHTYSFRDISPYTAASGVMALARETMMPEHDRAVACRSVYQMLLAFVQADPEQVDAVSVVIERALFWFRHFRENGRLLPL